MNLSTVGCDYRLVEVPLVCMLLLLRELLGRQRAVDRTSLGIGLVVMRTLRPRLERPAAELAYDLGRCLDATAAELGNDL